MSHKIQKFANNLVAILKNKLVLKPDKPADIRMYMLDLSEVYCTNSIMITLKINVTANQNYSLTLVV